MHPSNVYKFRIYRIVANVALKKLSSCKVHVVRVSQRESLFKVIQGQNRQQYAVCSAVVM